MAPGYAGGSAVLFLEGGRTLHRAGDINLLTFFARFDQADHCIKDVVGEPSIGSVEARSRRESTMLESPIPRVWRSKLSVGTSSHSRAPAGRRRTGPPNVFGSGSERLASVPWISSRGEGGAPDVKAGDNRANRPAGELEQPGDMGRDIDLQDLVGSRAGPDAALYPDTSREA